MSTPDPEIGKSVLAAGLKTNYLEAGSGPPLILVHGSGAGVTAYANWRLTIPVLAKKYRVIAPDLAGFGYTERKPGAVYNLDLWLEHLIGFMDALDIQQAGFVEMGDQTEGFSGSDIRDIVDSAVLERCLMSTHFKYVAGIDSRGKAHRNMLTPCSMGDSGAMEMTYNEVPHDRLLPPPVTLEDFQRVIRRSRSSVSQDELQKYVQWTADFGRNGS